MLELGILGHFFSLFPGSLQFFFSFSLWLSPFMISLLSFHKISYTVVLYTSDVPACFPFILSILSLLIHHIVLHRSLLFLSFLPSIIIVLFLLLVYLLHLLHSLPFYSSSSSPFHSPPPLPPILLLLLLETPQSSAGPKKCGSHQHLLYKTTFMLGNHKDETDLRSLPEDLSWIYH